VVAHPACAADITACIHVGRDAQVLSSVSRSGGAGDRRRCGSLIRRPKAQVAPAAPAAPAARNLGAVANPASLVIERLDAAGFADAISGSGTVQQIAGGTTIVALQLRISVVYCVQRASARGAQSAQDGS